MILHTAYVNEEAILKKGRYADGSTALVAYSALGEVLSKCTVCLDEYGEKPRDAEHVFIKDYSENEGMLKALQDAGIVGEVLRTVPCGFCTAHEVKLIAEVEPL